LVDEVKNSYNLDVSEWLSLRDLYYDGEVKNDRRYGSYYRCDTTNKIIHKKRDFKYILDHFEECTKKSLIGWYTYYNTKSFNELDQEEQFEYLVSIFEKYINRELTCSELEKFHDKVKDTTRFYKEMISQKNRMSGRILQEWHDWLEGTSYSSYDGYPVWEQIEIWNKFRKTID